MRDIRLVQLEALNLCVEEQQRDLIARLLADTDPAIALHPVVQELRAMVATQQKMLRQIYRLQVPHQARLLVAINRDGAASQYVYEPFDGIEINLMRHRR